ncbi:MAG: hypothetical protein KC466_20165 [Myxococcales bacterium]|nr:hypothetical protein [Myxococcales bacterium]
MSSGFFIALGLGMGAGLLWASLRVAPALIAALGTLGYEALRLALAPAELAVRAVARRVARRRVARAAPSR